MGTLPPRRLAVIFHADVVGSTTLVQRDERLAHQRIGDAFARLSAVVVDYGGKAHEVRGDALVAEFERASDAVCAALAFQAANSERNSALADAIRPEVRVGIGMGEVVIANGTVTGAGVVLAQRLEQLADAGGVVIQGAAHETIPRWLPFDYEFLGERRVKGFDESVRAFTVSLRDGQSVPSPEARARRTWSWRHLASGLVAASLILVAGAFAWRQVWGPEFEPASEVGMKLALPDKPSIAVLPFENLSAQNDQGLLADSFTESLINTLARVPGIFVISRNSTVRYRGRPVIFKEVAEDLGVQYVLEGGVQRSGPTIRVSAQLVDALSGRHVWADRYDREIEDLFSLQDDIAFNILRELQVVLAEGERFARETENLEAYLLYWNGIALYRNFNRDDNAQALRTFEQALELDPSYVQALVASGWTYQTAGRYGWSESRSDSYAQGAEIAFKALERDPDNPEVHALLSNVYLSQRKFAEAIEAGRKSIALGPSGSLYYANTAVATYYAGEFEETVALTKQAMRLAPFYPAWYLYRLGVAYRMLGRYEEALETLEGFYGRLPKPNVAALTALIATYAMMGRMEQARERVAETLRLYPKASIAQASEGHYFKDPSHLARIVDAWREAGLPE